ncbi:MAG: linear amide C-N hydrolase, partial [Proteobacteria bacterium]|nr:linear amide C-N hydrolase [Pseudomonadota bacterium]
KAFEMIKSRWGIFVVFGLTACLLDQQVFACTTYSYRDVQGHIYVAKSYDWDKEKANIHTNKRGVLKSALKVMPSDSPISWTSRFSSLSFNQYGRELPNSGINEAGVVVEVMVLDDSEYERPSAKRSINESQWVQYMLDMAGSVQEAKELSSKLRLSKILIPVHYLICDRTGSCAAFEMISGRLEISDLGIAGNKVLTNSTFKNSMDYLSEFVGFGGDSPIPTGMNSLDRFVRTSNHLLKANGLQTRESVGFGFEGLEGVENDETMWQIVYDIDAKRVYFRSRSAENVKYVDFAAFSPQCVAPVKTHEVVYPQLGDVTPRFIDYSPAKNESLVRESLGQSVPSSVLRMAIELPQKTNCVDPKSLGNQKQRAH